MVSLIFSFNSWNRAKCGDFKEKQYMITIPHLGSNYSSGNRGNSMMGIGADPSEMINYYYNQDMSGNAPAAANPAQQPIQQQIQQPAQQTGQQQGNQNPYSQEYRGEQYRNNYPR
jgi:hypothetical protein